LKKNWNNYDSMGADVQEAIAASSKGSFATNVIIA
jgi:hypothetical protein